MRAVLTLGFINGMVFLGGIWWLYDTGFPPLGAIMILTLTAFTMGILIGEVEHD